MYKYIHKYEEEFGPIRKENIPAPIKSHSALNYPETGISSLLDSDYNHLF